MAVVTFVAVFTFKVPTITIRTERQCRCIYCSAMFPCVREITLGDTCRNLLNLTKCELDGFDFCLRIRMPRLSEGLILHVRQHEIVWHYII